MNRPRNNVELFLPFLGTRLQAGEGVAPHVVREMAKAVNKAWLGLPMDARLKLRSYWQKAAGLSGVASVAEVRATPAAEPYNTAHGLIFSAGKLRLMSPEELEAEARQHLAAAVSAADGNATTADAVLKSWRAGARGRRREMIVCEKVTSKAQRELWGLPPLPQGMEEVVCPTLRDPARREKWGLPPLS